MDGGGSTTTVQNNVPEPTPEERELTALSAELAKRQLANIDALAPFQKRLLETGISELDQNAALRAEYAKAFPVEEQAALARRQADFQRQALDFSKQQFELQGSLASGQADFQRQALDLSKQDFEMRQRELDQSALDAPLQRQVTEGNLRLVQQQIEQATQLEPLQREILQQQLEQLKQGGRPTPEQLQAISEATQAGIDSGTADIDVQTKRGIGLISDELANSRGLRLTDTPITREATLLTRNADDAKAGFIRSMRANEANAKLNYPLAVQGVTNQTIANQSNIAGAAQNFQAQLRQQAQANRLALTGSGSMGSGIGLSTLPGFGGGAGVGLSSGYSPASTVGQAGGIGLGLAGISNGGSALTALTSARMASGSRTTSTENELGFGEILGGAGKLASGIGAMAAFSDRRLKHDYGTVGETSEGIGLHVYRYKGEPVTAPLRLGVMADEVRKVKPKAVRRHESGYDVVDYAGIGLAA